jgi:hypothetical protein
MAKLIDHNANRQPPIGNDGLLRFIDEINIIRARSGNRRRFKPSMRQSDNTLEMVEWDEITRPSRADTPSQRYSDGLRIGYG